MTQKVPSKKDIRDLSPEKLSDFLKELGEPSFRAKQIDEWLWQKNASSFEEMTNLSKKLREKLTDNFTLSKVKIGDVQKSSDGTIKHAFQLYDGKVVEGVLIPQGDRMTACISSQVGCSLACEFCATARLKRERNLSAAEIFDQVTLLNEEANKTYDLPLTNIVYMGMGEPLLNYKEVLASVDRITSENGLGMSPRRITISTVGVAKMIRKLGDDAVRFNLAVSLHAASDEKRSAIMDINHSNDLNTLREALEYFHERTGTRVTYEYIVFKDHNDSLKDADDLIEFCSYVPSKVNIIEYNPIDDGYLEQADHSKFDRFVEHLEKNGMIVNVRRSRGKDIDAACGQLANKNHIKKAV